MNVLYITSPLSKWDFLEDTTPLMISEVNRRGGTTFFTTRRDMFIDGVTPKCKCRAIEITQSAPWHTVSESSVKALADFDVIHIRTDPPFNIEYYYTTLLAEQAGAGTLVLNKPSALRALNEKLSIFNFPQFVTDSICTYNVEDALEFIKKVGGKAVAKELASCSSRGVTLLKGKQSDIKAILDKLTTSGIGPILIQRYLEKVVDGETRVTLIDGKPLGYMTKVPAKGNFLASMDFGATSAPCVLSARELEISETVGKFLKDRGVIFAALDIIDGYLSEINVTSPGVVRHTNKVMGVHLERDLEDSVEQWFEGKCRAF